MNQTETFRDWLFRYRYVYRSRSTDKSKQRFLKALIADIIPFRKDLQVIEYDLSLIHISEPTRPY